MTTERRQRAASPLAVLAVLLFVGGCAAAVALDDWKLAVYGVLALIAVASIGAQVDRLGGDRPGS